MAVVRYLVDDVEKAIAFYTDKLGFGLEQSMGPAFAIVSRGDLSLWLSGPQSSGARPMPDGRQPEPGGWNRLVIIVDALESEVDTLRDEGLSFRSRSCSTTAPVTRSSSSNLRRDLPRRAQAALAEKPTNRDPFEQVATRRLVGLELD
jgi:catechol 2,3-dioxygenase-like lactoylglutathione lyase family enzyme